MAATFPIDEEMYTYQLDKGPMTDFSVDYVAPSELASCTSLRVHGLVKAFSVFSGVPGHYFINTAGALAEGTSVQQLEAPLIATFRDRGVAPAFVLEWKTMNNKLYAMTIPTVVKICAANDDQASKWVTDRDIKPVKLALLESVEPVKNKNGFPFAKNLEMWMAGHSNHFRALNLKSLADCRQWCSYSRFLGHMEMVGKIVKDRFVEDVRAGQRNPSGETEVVLSEAHKRTMAAIEAMITRLTLHICDIGTPLSQRFLEITIDMETEFDSIDSIVTAALGRSTSEEQKTNLLNLLKKGSLFKLLQDGSCAPLPMLSPVKLTDATPDTVASVDEVGAEEGKGAATARRLEAELNPSDQGGVDVEADALAETEMDEVLVLETPQVVLGAKRARVPPERLRTVVPPFLASKTARTNSDSNSQPRTTAAGKRAPYQMSGLYSRDPVKAALAREKLMSQGLTPPNRGGNKGKKIKDIDFTTAVNSNDVHANGKDPVESGLVRELKLKVKDLEGEVAILRAQIASKDSKSDLLVEKARLEEQLKVKDQMQQAYDKGFATCKNHFRELKELQSSL